MHAVYVFQISQGPSRTRGRQCSRPDLQRAQRFLCARRPDRHSCRVPNPVLKGSQTHASCFYFFKHFIKNQVIKSQSPPTLVYQILCRFRHCRKLAVSQHVDAVSRNNKATTKCCCALHIVHTLCGDYLQPFQVPCLTASTLQKWRPVLRRRRTAACVVG